MDWFLGVIGFEEEELGDNGCGHGFVDFSIETNNSFLESNQTSAQCREDGDKIYLQQSRKDIIWDNKLTRLLFHHHHHHQCEREHTGVPATPLCN